MAFRYAPLLLLALVALATTATHATKLSSQITFAKPLASSLRQAESGLANTTLDKQLNYCLVKYATLQGTPNNVTTQPNDRLCFYHCDVNTNQWYSYSADTQTCSCFARSGITGIKYSTDKTVYSAFGYIAKCFPFCSVAVKSCKRCNTKKGGVLCVFNFSQRRCCCVPPAKPLIRKGFIAGCVENGRKAQERVDLEGHSVFYSGYSVISGPLSKEL